jgi:hypothetical protein
MSLPMIKPIYSMHRHHFADIPLMMESWWSCMKALQAWNICPITLWSPVTMEFYHCNLHLGRGSIRSNPTGQASLLFFSLCGLDLNDLQPHTTKLPPAPISLPQQAHQQHFEAGPFFCHVLHMGGFSMFIVMPMGKPSSLIR